jgi:cytochrome c553
MLRICTNNLTIIVIVFLGIFLLGISVTPGRAALKAATPGAQLFHKGGIGDCDGCHLMHNTNGEGGNTDPGSITNNVYGLKGSDPSSTCLNCHQAPASNINPSQHYIATNPAQMANGIPPKELTPGGDFGWIKKNYKWARNESSPGERHGHNIVAADYNYRADTSITVSPGGSYPAGGLSCISCHDPHGNYRRLKDGTIGTDGPPIVASGSYNNSPDPDASGTVSVYRMLAGKGYKPKYLAGGNAFDSDPPAAVAPTSYNRSESASDTRVAYGSGMSEWCGNCHAGIHNDNYPGTRRHPSGNFAKLTGEVTNNYNAYIASGNLNGNAESSYTSMVPFEMGTNDYGILKGTANNNNSNRSGASSSDNVMCLTCHRAHASGWDSMTRWNIQAEFIVCNGRYPGVDNGAPENIAQGRSAAEVQKTFYDRPAISYASYQRSLCNKCHAKD